MLPAESRHQNQQQKQPHDHHAAAAHRAANGLLDGRWRIESGRAAVRTSFCIRADLTAAFFADLKSHSGGQD
jgi:hypothetical protein